MTTQLAFDAAVQFMPWAFLAACLTVAGFLFFRYIMRTPLRTMFRRVPVSEVTGEDSESGEHGHAMQRVLGWQQLTIMGIAAIIGTGIFVLPGQAAALHAGPAVILSFVLCFFLCVIVALCYAEFASMIKSSGSAFMYAYATLGEIVAWIIGWDLLLEYAFGASGVAVGWSAYYKSINQNLFGPGQFHDAPMGTLWFVYGGIVLIACLTWKLSGWAVGRMDARRASAAQQKSANNGLIGWCWSSISGLLGGTTRMALVAAPYVIGLVAVGYAGIPDRFSHAPNDVPWLTLAVGAPIVLLLVALRLRYKPVLESYNTAPARLAGMVVQWAPLAAGLTALAWMPSVDLPAMLVTLGVSQLLVRGVHHTAKASTIFVVVKVAVIAVFIALGLSHIDPANWQPFFPERVFLTPGAGDHWEAHWAYGWQGMLTGAAIVLFAFIGFDGVTTAASETKKPQRDVPIGILASLFFCTIAYVLVAVVMTGCLHYSKLGGDESTGAAPIALVMEHIGLGSYSWMISLGAIAGITSALILSLYGQSRVQWSMASRGLVPQYMAKLDPRYGTPANAIQLWGWVAAGVAGLFSISELSELTNIGTLAAFILVMVGIVILRWTEPNRVRGFRCPSVISSVVNFVMQTILRRKNFSMPWIPDLPILGCIGCLAFMWALPDITKIRFVIWMALGFVVYFCYGFWHSKLRNQSPTGGEQEKK